ncbi:Glycosyltransferase, catalytic subunit of cellulose synthase and poly-beta-1,6-N-acetylglucosamine synthase [Haladaptatus litoreus]|uniref:Glycosyltransferase, catalytic subunit of cellulose synthase and poly-beta-1,6-N-acetylglucosamine synthase n=1 Tax=Haladaptatus litoreus TaxID=553468 RepID=A0A1N6XR67_9EURY|nr:glycosyltransferase [Haladaptatus litoreus]SIR04822.1 Glycosyltransferase, catalytic subunit of cellulose synthase and poly-beta-1,6-N-acetylglucosamine synthase [Haladaptatus litoreus]
MILFQFRIIKMVQSSKHISGIQPFDPLPPMTSMSTDSDTTPVERDAPDTQPQRNYTPRRILLALTLFTLGGIILLMPIPGFGSIGIILYTNPLFLIVLGGWYIGRSTVATIAHALRARRHRTTVDGHPYGEADATPSVSILIPAYNEAHEIGATIDSLRALTYPGDLEIIVVDDGSEDGTWYALQALADRVPGLRVFTQENAGSAAARNTALSHARNEVVVSLDADTVMHPSTVTELARHFTSPEIVAVGGNVNVENTHAGLWAKSQVFDYALAMEIGRMFQSFLGYVLCLSGAFGAFRRKELIATGGWNEHWLYSDDFEVSVRIQEFGDVIYNPVARADTEVPTTIRAWFDQRKTWAQRGISVMLLHHRKQFNPGAGMVSIGLFIRAALTAAIIVKMIGFIMAMATGAIPVVHSLVWVIGVSLIGMAGLCAIMLGILSLLVVSEKPIQYGWYAVAYLVFYRPLHMAARLTGFAEAFWWELSSKFGSLRSTPGDHLRDLSTGDVSSADD